ncbi:hypothetical protein [Pseudomonas sp. RIT-PI-S]|uniref:hypothetical protein n=1 Tax=Pseudomonas sp. RIT-PI-S TaxID=3035295 RepID=UPI0021D97E79|nr:hypothetical protein [Pseudomonas sp. RIT-PI-S]
MKLSSITMLVAAVGSLGNFALGSSTALAALPIRLQVVLHNDIPSPLRGDLEEQYLRPWIREMESTFGRAVQLHIRHNVPGLSDLDYNTPDRRYLVTTLTKRNEAFWAAKGDGKWNYRVDKTLLLVHQSVIPDDPSQNEVVGEARHQGTAAWASLKTYSAPGHELGHMFGATHENAEVLFNGWFCETYTYPTRQNVRSNCYRYSDRNREAINAYLSEVP